MKRSDHQSHAKLPPAINAALTVLTLLTAIVVFLFFAQIAFPKGERCFLPARYTAAGVPTSQFVDPDDLEDGTWTSIEAFTYRNGEEATRVHIDRPVLAPYSMSVSACDGSTTHLLGANDGKHGGGYSDYLVSADDTGLVARSVANFQDGYVRGARVDTLANTHMAGMVIYSPDPDGSEDMSFSLYITYENTDEYRVTRMEATTDPESDRAVTITRTFAPYEGDRFTEAVDTDADGNVLRRIASTSENGRSVTEVHDADGTLLSTQETTYDWLGRIRNRTVSDDNGELVSEEVFHYRIWERFASLPGIAFALVFVGAALTIALELRATLKRAVLRKLERDASESA